MYNIPITNPYTNTPTTPTLVTIIITKPYNIPVTNPNSIIYNSTATHTTVNIIDPKSM